MFTFTYLSTIQRGSLFTFFLSCMNHKHESHVIAYGKEICCRQSRKPKTRRGKPVRSGDELSCEFKWRWTSTVTLILRRTVRRPLKIKGVNTGKPFSQLEDIEFVFPKEYNKMLKPVFYEDFDFDAKVENGMITLVLTPTSKSTSGSNSA